MLALCGVLLLLQVGEITGDIAYVGCFSSSNDAGLDALVVTGTEANSATCGLICHDAGFRFAGVKNDTTCVCGDIYMFNPPGSCTRNCKYGGPGEKCGGPNSISIYRTTREDIIKSRLKMLRDTYRRATKPPCFDRYGGKDLVPGIYNSDKAKYDIVDLGALGSVSDCENACARNAKCTAFTYYHQKHKRGKHCYGMSSTLTYQDDDSNVESGKQRPCGDTKEGVNKESKSIVGPAAGIAILAFSLIGFHLHITEKFKKFK